MWPTGTPRGTPAAIRPREVASSVRIIASHASGVRISRRRIAPRRRPISRAVVQFSRPSRRASKSMKSRSSRVTESPSDRARALTRSGPSRRRRRFEAVLSLSAIILRASCAYVQAVPGRSRRSDPVPPT